MKKKNKLITAYLLVWIVSLIVFWCLISGSDAMAFALLFLYIIIPITTFIVSLLIGKNGYWDKAKWLTPLAFGAMYMLAEYATFSLKNMITISFERINVPHFELILIGAVISVIGLGIGAALKQRKSKR